MSASEMQRFLQSCVAHPVVVASQGAAAGDVPPVVGDVPLIADDVPPVVAFIPA